MVRREERLLEVLVEDADLSLLQVLQYELLRDGAVEFAAYRRPHPLERKYFLAVRTKEGEPREALLRAIERARETVDSLGGEVARSLGVQ